MSETNIPALLRSIPGRIEKVRQELSRRIYGQDELILQLLAGIVGRGHCLLTGVPGLAKTLLVSSIAEIADLDFKRVQFTPDMMPGDITGSEILEVDKAGGERVFKFVKGPIFTQLMQERCVTVAGVRHRLPDPFFVLATQNPIEQEGTYPLPEAQLDRFMFGLEVGYPSYEDELKIMLNTTAGSAAPLEKVLSTEELLAFQKVVEYIPLPDSVVRFAARIVRATRPGEEGCAPVAEKYIRWGAGPRAGQCLAHSGKVFAAFDGRMNVSADDILKALEPVMRHRIILNYRAEADRRTIHDILAEIIQFAK